MIVAPSGLELLRGAQRGDTRFAALAEFLGMTIERVDEGEVVFALTTRPEFANPLGTTHGGICATLLDSVLGCAVHSTLAAGESYTTLQLSVNYVRAVPTDGTLLRATGRTVHVGRTTATAEGTVLDGDGRLVAHGTTTILVRR